jgi:hypothetical protein
MLVVRRWLGTAQRVLVANFGAPASLPLADTPGLDAMAGADWRLLFSTADRQFGGSGCETGLCGGERDRQLRVPARNAAIFKFAITAEGLVE